MQETVTRRNLPHWYVPGAMHFVTFRLAGSLPRLVIDNLKQRKEEWLRQPPAEGLSISRHREQIHKKLFAVYDKYLDQQRDGDHWLKDARIAALLRSSLYHFNGERYQLLSYCIMPNHVHVLFLPFGISAPPDEESPLSEVGETDDGKSPLSSIMHSIKSYTAHQANKILNRSGQFWQHESYDHWVRGEDELERIVSYINANPVEAGLAGKPHDFYWCSAHDRHLTDGDKSGWLLS